MDGSINFSGTLAGSIADGGGGGSTVTITPTLESGTKIADYSIDSNEGSLYAPTPPTLPDHIITDLYATYVDIYPRAEIARYKKDNGELQSIYAPYTYTTWEPESGVSQDVKIGSMVSAGVNNDIYIPEYQAPLTAGTGIDITNNVISCTASGSSWDYSTSEVDTGQKWIDGCSIYCKVFELSSAIIVTTSSDYNITSLADFSNIKQPIKCYGIGSVVGEEETLPLLLFKYNNAYYVGKVPTAVQISKLMVEYTKV